MNQIFARRADSVVIPYVPLFPSFLGLVKLYVRSRQPIKLPHSPTGYPKRREETSLVCGPRKPRRSPP